MNTAEKIGGFTLEKVTMMPEIQARMLYLVHDKTGAKVLHIENDDPENVFCLSFKTYPKSSNGVAHILEHTVLCGSEKYPVKDPFFSMTRRSLNTFMNAFTGADFTLYPAATQVEKDFYNLLSVYSDAVFHPKLDRRSFLQEGHRFEFKNPEDSSSPLEIKGIVYNEMKGDQSSPEGRLSDVVHAHLFPHLPYGFNFGGDPEHIPSLTYEELLEFHKSYYHPSRCLFYFYGNFPLEKHLEFLDTEILKGVEKLAPIPLLPFEKGINPTKVTGYYPIREGEKEKDKTLLSFSFLTCPLLNSDELFALELIQVLMMGTDASPLKKALMETKLCKQAIISMEDDYSQVPVSLTLKGCNPESAEKLEKTLFETLASLAKTGFEKEKIEDALHQLEFQNSEILGDNLPYGLILFMRAGPVLQHGGKAEDALVISTLADTLRKNIEHQPNYLGKLIQKYFLENPHYVQVTYCPDPTLGKKEEQAERERIEAVAKTLSENEKTALVKQAIELEAFQNEDNDPECLPKVTLADIPKKGRSYPLAKEAVNGLNLYHHDTFTNKILYATLVFDLPDIPFGKLPFVRLLSVLLSQLGTGGKTWEETLNEYVAHTGGIGASVNLNLQAQDFNAFTPTFAIQGKALYRKSRPFFALFERLLGQIDFQDPNRIKTLVEKQVSSLESSLKHNPLSWAIGVASKDLDAPSKVSSMISGMEYFKWLKDLAENFSSKQQELIDTLQEIYSKILASHRKDLVLTCGKEMKQTLLDQEIPSLAKHLKGAQVNWKQSVALAKGQSHARAIASPVAHIATLFKTVPYQNPISPHLAVAARLFDNLVLHTRIREQGGAYGVGATSGSTSGTFTFYSSRDPNIVSTFEAFEDAVEEIARGEFTDENLEEAILETVQGLDSPVAPGSRGNVGYTWMREGKTDQVRQAWRDALLGTRREDVIKAVKELIEPKLKSGVSIVFGGKELIEKENSKLAKASKEALLVHDLMA